MEELLTGGHSKVVRFVGEAALSELQAWCMEKNELPKPSKKKLWITIYSKDCTTPRRIMDMPGVRSNDADGQEGFNDIIVEMVLDELKKPDSIVLALADAHNESTTDQMVALLKKHRKSLEGVNLHHRFRLVLTKSDHWFQNSGPAKDVEEHLHSWQVEMFGCEPMLVGSSLDRHDEDDSCAGRTRQYRTAEDREKKSIQECWDRKLHKLSGNPDFVKYWEEKVGFEKAVRIVEDHALDMDLGKVPQMSREIQLHQAHVQAEKRQVQENLKNNDPDKMRSGLSKLRAVCPCQVPMLIASLCLVGGYEALLHCLHGCGH